MKYLILIVIFLANHNLNAQKRYSIEETNYLDIYDKDTLLSLFDTGEPVTGTVFWLNGMGQIADESNYKNGKLHGKSRSWSGEDLEHEFNYIDGLKIGIQTVYSTIDKKILGQVNLIDGNGQFKYTDDYGQKYEENYVNGKLDGINRIWYSNGQIMQDYNYKDGKENGLCRKWFEIGRISDEFIYNNGKLDGICKKWYGNGQMESQEIFQNGVSMKKKCWDGKGNSISCED